MRLADQYVAAVTQAVEAFQEKLPSPEAREEALKWKLSQATAAYINATGQNPTANALDMVVLATLSRLVQEDYWTKTFGAAAQSLVEVHRALETNMWAFASRSLTSDQQQELKKLIHDWRAHHPEQRIVSTVRFQQFVAALGQEDVERKDKPSSVFSLFFMDPLAGLDPAARAIEETRLLGERAMFYSQRMPTLLNWQVELLAYQLAAQPESKQVLSDADRLTRSTEVFANTAAQLPKWVDIQREAAIQQLFNGIATERTNFIASLASEELKMRALLAETRQTLQAGSEMATSVKAAIQSLDSFVRYVSPPTPTHLVPVAASTNERPFDILDYGQAAAQIGGAAKDLSGLLTSVNQTAPQVARLGQQATTDAERLVWRAFWLGLVLILVLLTGSVAAALTYRCLARRWLPERGSIDRS